jgi:hypothetical protein
MIWASHQAKDQPELRFFFKKKKRLNLYTMKKQKTLRIPGKFELKEKPRNGLLKYW